MYSDRPRKLITHDVGNDRQRGLLMVVGVELVLSYNRS